MSRTRKNWDNEGTPWKRPKRDEPDDDDYDRKRQRRHERREESMHDVPDLYKTV
jgi:hypothetical protein